LFGSYANESNNEFSDIDILVELEKPIGWKYFSLELYLEKIFDRKIDLVTKNALKKYNIEKSLKGVIESFLINCILMPGTLEN
jgi:predicted nucleotidyltransferase